MEWCDGKPLQRKRPLTPEERARFTAERKGYRLRAWCTTLGFVAAVFVFLAATAHVDSSNSAAEAVCTVLGIGFVVGIPVVILVTRDANRRSRQLRDDLRADRVVRYGDESGSVEVLPVSRRLLNARGWEFAGPAIETADAPETAGMHAPIAQDWDLPGVSRALTDAEKQEIRRVARRTWGRPMWPAILFTLWASIPLALLLCGEKLDVNAGSARFLIVVFAAIASDAAFAAALGTARRLGADIAAGTVETRTGAPGEGYATLEWLVNAERPWTIDGKPADWRKLPVT